MLFVIGRELKIWLKLERIKVFTTVIFPSGVNLLCFHWYRIFSHLFRIRVKFKVVMFSRSTEKWIPSKSNSDAPESKFSQVSYMSVERFFFVLIQKLIQHRAWIIVNPKFDQNIRSDEYQSELIQKSDQKVIIFVQIWYDLYWSMLVNTTPGHYLTYTRWWKQCLTQN